MAAYTGSRAAWVREQLDLTSCAGQSAVKIRFRLVTDASVVMDGWYIDDVLVGEAPQPPVLTNATAQGVSAVNLAWSPSPSTAVSTYRIYRSATAQLDWRSATLVGETPASTTCFTDVTVAPKTQLHYMVMALTSEGLHAMSDEKSVLLPPGMDYPFIDTVETDGAYWVGDGGWARSDERACSGTRAWSDSPGALYPNSSNAGLSLAAPLNLAAAQAPVLSFRQQCDIRSGDSAVVEASINNGADWTALKTYTALTATNAWSRERISLSAYVGQPSVLLRFRLTTSPADQADGWWLDDVSVAEAPPATSSLLVDQATSHTLRLSWPQSTAAQFSHYAIHRVQASSGVTPNSPCVATINDPEQTEWIDAGLALDTEYAYRVYVVSPYGTYSEDGAESSARTLNNPLPFVDGFEDGDLSWNFSGLWGITTETNATGNACLTDSPLGFYATYLNSGNNYALTAVDLTGTAWPVLRFKDRHAFYDVSSGDYGILEVSPDGSGWTRVYAVSGARAEWAEQAIDLSRWRGQANLRIRFYISSDGGGAGDGWHIDDVSVAEHTPGAAQALPFIERFEDGLANWLSGSWGASPNAFEGGGAAEGYPCRWTAQNRSSYWIVLGRELNLSGAAAPQVTFWIRRSLGDDNARLYLTISKDGGVNWHNLSGHPTHSTTWTRHQFAIPADYRVANLRLALHAYAYYDTGAKLQVDKLTVEESPPAVTLASPVPSLKSVALTWSPYAGDGFQRYEVFRHTAPGVNEAHTLIATFTDPSTTAFTDTGLSIGKTYHYRVYVVNTNDTYAGSNEAQATTVPLLPPLEDAFNDLSLWDTLGGWGIETNGAEVCLTDSPGVQYATSLHGGNNYALTAVDLTGTAWPVLRFKDRHAFYDVSSGDYGILEVSPDGSGWTRVYSVSGARAEWAEQAIDLSRWRGQANLRIRFCISSDGSGTGDGWYIDDVNVAEHAPGTAQTLPFAERFEDGLGNWLNGGWGASTNAFEGSGAAEGYPCNWTAQNQARYWMVLDRELDLTGAAAPQVTLWARRSQGDDYAGLFCLLSKDGGLSWHDLSGHIARGPEWTRHQFAIPADYRVANLRFAFQAHAYYNVEAKLQVDKLTVEDSPPAVTLASPVPSLKSVALTWSPYAGGDFQRYEIYRRDSSGVTWSDTRVASIADSAATAFTDNGLSIGKTYHYRVYIVNTNDTYAGSNEAQATTVPLLPPLEDAFNDLSLWDTLGGWGIETNDAEVCLTDSPGVQYATYLNSGNNYALTAVDLTGTAWPVLRFKDRHAFYDVSSGDYGILDVSSDGSNWTRVYAVSGARAEWAEQAVDLSRWRGQANLHIRFYIESNGSGTGDGWHIDDVGVAEHAPGAVQALPFVERFENGLGNWLNGGWIVSADAYEGTGAAEGYPCRWTARNRARYWMVLDRELDLTGSTAPQVTLWAKRSQGDSYTRLHILISKDGGLGWRDLSGQIAQIAEWTRYQFAIPSDHRVANLRLALCTYDHYGDTAAKLQVDKLTVEESPPAVTLETPTDVTVSGLSLAWSPYAGGDFQCYKVFRHTAQNVDETHTLVATITDPDVTNFTDTALSARIRYFYKVYVYNTSDTGTPSNEASAQTLGVPLGWTDDFGSGVDPAWTFSGTWGIQDGAGVNGTPALTDSPGDYANYSDTWAQTAADLSAATWPVLVFTDRHALPPTGDNAYVQIGAADNNNVGSVEWFTVYSTRGTRADWCEQQIDLSRWKGRHTVYIRFRLGTDGSVTDDGWAIDNVAIREHTPLPVASSLHERFENGLDTWINGGWAVSAVTPYEGGACVLDHVHSTVQGYTDSWLVYGGELDLSGMDDAMVTLYARGWRGYNNYGHLNVRLSKDGGVNWHDLSGALNVADTWGRFQYAVPADYRTAGVRIAVSSYAHRYDLDSQFYIDAFGIGGAAPGAPVPLTPADGATVTMLRPALVVENAVDNQSDLLTYRFEVYTNAVMSAEALVAQTPAIAGGTGTTSWQIDADLPDGAQVWWRCRATDNNENIGPWSATATFVVNLVNHAPTAPEIISPYAGATMPDANGYFIWFASEDSDPGDAITGYQLQIASDETFTNILVTAVIAPQPSTLLAQMKTLPGYDALVLNARYYWRVCALDIWSEPSPWSTAAFVYGELQTPELPEPPAPVTVTSIQMGANNLVTLSWTPSERPVRVEFTRSLTHPQWTAIEGATGLTVTTAVVPYPADAPCGFFRVVVENAEGE